MINNSLLAAHPESPFFGVRAGNEANQIALVGALTDRIAIVLLRAAEPIGEERLTSVTKGHPVPAPGGIA